MVYQVFKRLIFLDLSKLFNMVQFTDLLTITLTLFAVIDILGNIPLLISIKQKTGHINSIRVTWISTIIMLIFLFVG